MSTANYSINHSAVASGAAGDGAMGTAVLKTDDGYIIASAANRTAQGRRSDGVALEAFEAGHAFRVAHDGLVDEVHSGLADGAKDDYVIVAADGTLSRTASPAGSDDIIGRCPGTNGDFHLNPGMSADGGGGGSSVGATGVVQASDGSGGFAAGYSKHASNLIQDSKPRVGDGTMFASEGLAGQDINDADASLDALVYSRSRIFLFSTPAVTAPRTITWPHPASSDAAVKKYVGNATAQPLLQTTGTGTTVTLRSGEWSWLHISTGGIEKGVGLSPGSDGSAITADGEGGLKAASSTGTGDFVRQTSPTLITPVIGAATGTSLDVSSFLEAESIRFTTAGTSLLGQSGAIRVDPNNTRDIIVTRTEDDSGDLVLLSHWTPAVGKNELAVGNGQAVGTQVSRLVLSGADFVRALAGSYTAWRAGSSGGLQLHSNTEDFGDGVKVVGIDNATTNPTTNPTAGIVLYVDGADNVLKYRKADGTTVSLSGGGAVAGADTQVIYNDGGAEAGDADHTWTKATNLLYVAGSLKVGGATASSVGSVKCASSATAGVYVRNAADTLDIPLCASDTGENISIGHATGSGSCITAVAGNIINRSPGFYVQSAAGAADRVIVNSVGVRSALPYAGMSDASKAFALGVTLITKSDATDLSLTAAQYENPQLEISGTPGGNFNINAPEQSGAVFCVKNGTANTCTIKKSGGTGVTIAASSTAWVRFDTGAADYKRTTADVAH